ncbi:MAG TPA: family 16 glycoside hydrolase, partial [Planctomycetota bacterium]|nr:family 16 glycoside hydrolase [Planctomycetota bacterium]
LIPPGPDDFRPVGITTTPDGMGFYVTDWNFAAWKRRKDDAGRLFKLTWKGPNRAAPKPAWYAAASRGEKVDVDASALQHPSRSLRLAAMRRLGPPPPPPLDLRSADAAVRFKAAAALGRKGEKAAVPALLEALGDDDAVVRHGAMSALQRIGAWAETSAGLSAGSIRIQEGTLYALREAYDLVVVKALLEFAERGPAELRPEAERILTGLHRKPPPWDGRWWRNGPYASAEDNPKVGPRIDHTVDWEGTPLVRAVLGNKTDGLSYSTGPLLSTDVPPPASPPTAADPAPYAEFAARSSGDPGKGRVLYNDPKAGCARCHRIGTQGGQIGPDLAGIGTKYGRPSLIESVLYPSRQIAEGYSQTLVRTRDGAVIAGLVRAETADDLTLVDAEGKVHALRKADLDARRLGDRSLMPDGLQSALSLQEFADLVAFLESLQDNEGFVPLFNGKDLAGWKTDREHEGHWVVKDGFVRYDAKGKDLWTEKSYGDFILKAEWRFPGTAVEKEAPVILPDGSVSTRTEKVMDAGDSGIFLRGAQKSQVNLWCWPVGSGEIYGYRTDGRLAPEIRAAATPRVRADKPPGEWNRLVITMKGEVLTVVLNGTPVIDQARLPGIPAKGPLGLQRPGKPLTPDMPVDFANFLIKELP